jgi:hypothetical protein
VAVNKRVDEMKCQHLQPQTSLIKVTVGKIYQLVASRLTMRIVKKKSWIA